MRSPSLIAPTWTADLLARWRLPEACGGNEWAERCRVLGVDENRDNSGTWRSVYWQRELLDAFGDPLLDWIVVQKASQMGVSELVRCAIGRWALIDPGDVLWVMATEHAAKKAMKKLQAMFRNTPALRHLRSERKRDTTLLEMVLTNGMRIVIGWAGSAQSLASDPFRYVILDEVALYSWSTQGEGNPVRLAEDRTKVYGRRAKVILLSKPKDQSDSIVTQFEESTDRRAYAVPCPECDHLQVLEFDALRWPGGSPADAPTEPQARARLADRIVSRQAAWFECLSCEGRIRDVPRAGSDSRARWVRYDADGEATDTVTSRRRAYHVSEVYHWSKGPWDLAARWLSCNTPHDLQVFWCGSLGKPLVTQRSEIPRAVFGNRAIHPRGVVPAYATNVLATADTQADGWWFYIRAWGAGRKSRTLEWGWVTSLAELHERTLGARFPLEGSDRTVRPESLGIDTGGGQEPDGAKIRDLYRWILETPGAYAIKGEGERESGDGAPIRWTKQSIGDDRIELCRPNTNWFKDQAAALIRETEPVLWEECEGSEEAEYGRQMTGQVLQFEKRANGKGRWVWRKRRGRPDHLWDCAAYQLVSVESAEMSDNEPSILAGARASAEQFETEDDDAWADGSGWWDRP